jgi:hypothetical protein
MNSLELRDRIFQFVYGEISLHDLEEWLVPNTPELITNPDSADAGLVAAVELALAEYSDGTRDEDSVKSYFRDALQEFNTVFLDLTGNPMSWTVRASNTTTECQVVVPVSQAINLLTVEQVSL